MSEKRKIPRGDRKVNGLSVKTSNLAPKFENPFKGRLFRKMLKNSIPGYYEIINTPIDINDVPSIVLKLKVAKFVLDHCIQDNWKRKPCEYDPQQIVSPYVLHIIL